MTKDNLKKRLEKRNILYTEKDYNGYNKSIIFAINGKTFEADYEEFNHKIDVYSHVYDYDNLNQEHNRFFFHSLNQVIRYANN